MLLLIIIINSFFRLLITDDTQGASAKSAKVAKKPVEPPLSAVAPQSLSQICDIVQQSIPPQNKRAQPKRTSSSSGVPHEASASVAALSDNSDSATQVQRSVPPSAPVPVLAKEAVLEPAVSAEASVATESNVDTGSDIGIKRARPEPPVKTAQISKAAISTTLVVADAVESDGGSADEGDDEGDDNDDGKSRKAKRSSSNKARPGAVSSANPSKGPSKPKRRRR